VPARTSVAQFEALVDRAVAALPGWVHEHMQNVLITTALWPSAAQQRVVHVRGQMLLGLYEGVPLTRRGSGYHLHPPDRITLFQRPLEQVADSEADLEGLIRDTIVHEIAHHFGFSEEDLARLERRG